MSLTAVWDQAQIPIKEKIGPTSYETWFSSLQVKEKNPETLVIETPDEFFKNWIVEHYLEMIEQEVAHLAPHPLTLLFEVNPKILKHGTQSRLTKFEKGFEEVPKKKLNLNSRFVFENFVSGPSNRFAHAACQAVAESPAKAYNPLFIYGGVGLGKTHLMQAITHRIQQTNPKLKHCYLTSERFTNELIDAIRHGSTAQFRQKYRGIDVLLIDDIHFIAGKESTQEEFFHTFNALHDSRKQIIISSDRPPKEIANLEERLQSRFAWGLITDVQAPDFETRMAILRKKIENETVHVPDDVIYFIAEQVKSNIRELEGALVRVIAYSILEDRTISLDMVKIILKDMVRETLKVINVEKIQKDVADHFHISVSELKASRRNKAVVLPRQVAMYLSRQLTSLSLPEIGNAFGGKDHTTVLHSCKKITQTIEKDKNLQYIIEKLTVGLKQ